MSYIDASYILKMQDETELMEVLSVDDVQGSDVLAQSIVDAQSTVDEALFPLYTIPLTSPSSTIKKITAFIALYYMYSYRYTDKLPERIVNDYNYAMKYLKDVSMGNIKIENQTETEVMSTVILTNKDSDSKIFNSTKLGQIK